MAKEKKELQQQCAAQPEGGAEVREERVEVFVPKGFANEEPQLFIGINGINFLLPRGKTSLVPRAVAQELSRARRAEELQDRRISRLQEEKL